MWVGWFASACCRSTRPRDLWFPDDDPSVDVLRRQEAAEVALVDVAKAVLANRTHDALASLYWSFVTQNSATTAAADGADSAAVPTTTENHAAAFDRARKRRRRSRLRQMFEKQAASGVGRWGAPYAHVCPRWRHAVAEAIERFAPAMKDDFRVV